MSGFYSLHYLTFWKDLWVGFWWHVLMFARMFFIAPALPLDMFWETYFQTSVMAWTRQTCQDSTLLLSKIRHTHLYFLLPDTWQKDRGRPKTNLGTQIWDPNLRPEIWETKNTSENKKWLDAKRPKPEPLLVSFEAGHALMWPCMWGQEYAFVLTFYYHIMHPSHFP